MAELFSAEELETKIKELLSLRVQMITDTHRACIKCLAIYETGRRDICYCDYESEEF